MSMIVSVSYSFVKYFLEEIKPLLKNFNFKHKNLDSFINLDSQQRLNSMLLLISHEMLFPEENIIKENLYYNHYYFNTVDLSIRKLIPSFKFLLSLEQKLLNELKKQISLFIISKYSDIEFRNNKSLSSVLKKVLESKDIDVYSFYSKGFVKEKYLNKDILEGYLQELKKKGWFIIPNFVTEKFLDELIMEINTICKFEKDNEYAYLYGENFNLQRVYNLIGKSPLTRVFLQLEPLIYILNRFFSRETLHDLYSLSSVQSNHLSPKAEAQQWHIDNNMPEPIPLFPIRLNINLTLTEFNNNNGSTEVISGSHKSQKKPSLEDIEKSFVTKLIAPKGSLVVWNGSLWHRSTSNESNKERSALLACFCSSVIRELTCEENYNVVYKQENLEKTSVYLKNIMSFDHGIKSSSKLNLNHLS